ncbi:hypothetical protein [Leptospira jelokensis]|uniref:hypothetical protein n=1 Tax=Leptospira jelokensis TaxID=2484931 RepID=UPI0010914E0F|nr:hypothetical protein [Leptospira jelokensis]TGM06658.1 hypothetical protein EHQ79_01510 [Leptospira jelokensis]
MRFFVKLWFILITILSSIDCSSDVDIVHYVQNSLKDRVGKPAIFKINSNEYSMEKFREDLRFKRLVLEGKPPSVNPEEVKEYLDRYIEETVLLNEAVSEVDFKSAEFKSFISAYLFKGIIEYYLFSKTGGFEITKELDINSEIIAELKSKGIIKSTLISNDERKMISDMMIWRKLEISSKKRQEDIKLEIAKIKLKNKVIINPIQK